MKKISVYLPEQQIEALKELQAKTGIPTSEYIRRAIESLLSNIKRKEKQSTENL